MKKSILTAFIFLAIPLVSYASIINTEMGYGSTGAQVLKLQQFLINGGYLQGTATGNFYSLTQQAVEAYQSAHGISPTGYVGSLTRGAINENSSSTTSQVSSPSTAVTASACPQGYSCTPIAPAKPQATLTSSSQTQQPQASPCIQGYVYSSGTGCTLATQITTTSTSSVFDGVLYNSPEQAALVAKNTAAANNIISSTTPNYAAGEGYPSGGTPTISQPSLQQEQTSLEQQGDIILPTSVPATMVCNEDGGACSMQEIPPTCPTGYTRGEASSGSSLFGFCVPPPPPPPPGPSCANNYGGNLLYGNLINGQCVINDDKGGVHA
jgi:peptidoglycan hydrolase-like protein with peptidoglycan-binding domain